MKIYSFDLHDQGYTMPFIDAENELDRVWRQSTLLKTENDFSGALNLALKVHAQDSSNPKYICGVAHLYTKLKQINKAQKLYLPIAEQDVIAANGLAQTYLLEKKYPEAEFWYNKNAEQNEFAANGLAQTYLLQRMYPKAENWYRKNADQDKVAAKGLAQTCLLQRKYPEAEHWFGKHADYDLYAANGLAQTHLLQGNYLEAEYWYFKNADKDKIAANGLAKTHLVQHQYNKAENWYRKNADHDAFAANGLAQTYLVQGKHAKAEFWYLKNAVHDEVAVCGLAKTYLAQKKFSESENIISSVEPNSNDPFIFYVGAITALKCGDLQKAKKRIFTMADRCPFNVLHVPFLKLLTEVGVIEEPLYNFILTQESLRPEKIVPKSVDSILEEFNSNLDQTDISYSQPRISSVYQANFAKPVNRQTQRISNWNYHQNSNI